MRLSARARRIPPKTWHDPTDVVRKSLRIVGWGIIFRTLPSLDRADVSAKILSGRGGRAVYECGFGEHQQ